MKAILFSLFLTTTFFCNAQDASNDATWEETIDFIKKNKSFFVKSEYWKKTSNYEFDIDYKYAYISYTVREDLLYNMPSYYINYSTSIDLKKIKTADHGYIKLTGDYIKVSSKRKGKSENVSYDNIEGIYIEDTEMKPRLIKAFQHLAYLATKKREEARKASGDKF